MKLRDTGGLFGLRFHILMLVGLFLAIPARGAIGIDATASGDQNTARRGVSTPAFSTASGNELLLAFISGDKVLSAKTTVTGVTGAGLTWVLVVRTNTQLGTSEIWRAFAPSPLSNVTVTATLSQTVASSITVMSFTGVDTSGTNGSGAMGNTGMGNANPGAPTATLVTTRNNSWVFGVGNDSDNAIARTPGTSQTIVHQLLASVGDTYWMQEQNAATPLSGTPVTINDSAPTGDGYNLSIVEVLAAAGGGGSTFSISGTISPTSIASGTLLTLTGGSSSTTVTANSSGTYTFANLANGTYTVTPSQAGYTFSPTNKTVTINGGNFTAINFTGTAVTWSISGAAGVSGATLTLSGMSSATAIADGSGNYTFSGLASGNSYTVTPTKSGYTFSPTSQLVPISGANVTAVSFTAQVVASPTCPCTVWSSSATPTFIDSADPAAVNLGVKFRTEFNGYITGIRFYKARTNIGTHIGNIWTSTGTLLGSVTFTNETSSGWQQMNFGNPIAVNANTTYIASYFAPNGHYSQDEAFFATSGVDNPPLHLLANGVDGPNGVYAYASLNSFPNATYNTENYWVDVVYTTNPGAIWGISGTISPTSVGSGTVVTLSGTSSGTVTADSSGNYNFANPVNGNYTVTPTKSGYTFSPTSLPVTISGGNAIANFTATPMPTYSISGTISPTASGSGTTVKLGGAASATVTADTSGNYTFSGLASGNSYTVTPTKSGYTFSPTSQLVPISGTNGTANFTATPVTYSISGKAGVSGATVALSGTSTATTATADASGNYTFAGLANGPYTVTPTKSGFTFTPASQNVTVSGANPPAINFTAQAVSTWSISGTIPGGSGATVTLAGPSTATTTADTSGNYIFIGLADGTYVVSPTNAGFTFVPSNQTVTLSSSNVIGVNFTVQMATIAVDATTSKDQGTPSGTVATSTFSTTSANELLLAFISTDAHSGGTNTSVSSVAGGGLTWILVERTNAQLGTSEIWRAFAPTTLSNVTVTAALSQTVMSSITVMSFTGVDTSGTNGSGAIGATGTGNANPGAPAAMLVTTRINSRVFGVGTDWDNAIARTPGTNQTIIHQLLASVGDTYWVQMVNSSTPLSGATVTVSDTAPTGDRYNFSICEILPAVGSSPPPTFTLSGVVGPATSGSGATITLSGAASRTATADANGNYAFTGLVNGSYTMTPGKSAFTFTPASQSVTITSANLTTVNFTASAAPIYTISGMISPATLGSGALVTLSGTAAATTTVNGTGTYSLSGLPNGTYTVTPSSLTAVFSPASQTVTINGANSPSVNFTASSTSAVIFYDDFTGTALSSAWTVISRHGEYAQNETECNIPQQVSVANGFLTIATAAQSAACGDFNTDGSLRHTPASWPYMTGDIQWTNLNFTYGTVEIRAQFPAKGTGLWPALWLFGANCQATNIYTADVGYSTCPTLSQSSYAEIDMVECDLNNWCQLALSNTTSFPTCGWPVDTNFHVFTLTWTASAVTTFMDGQPTGCSFTSGKWTIPSTPMFLLIQTQTGGAGGTPDNALLPADFVVDYVKVTQP